MVERAERCEDNGPGGEICKARGGCMRVDQSAVKESCFAHINLKSNF